MRNLISIRRRFGSYYQTARLFDCATSLRRDAGGRIISANSDIDSGNISTSKTSKDLWRRPCMELLIATLLTDRITNLPSLLIAYLIHSMGELRTEQFRTLFIDHAGQLLPHQLIINGEVESITITPQSIMREARKRDAAAIILVHNHPSMNPAPSQADIEVTRAIVRLANLSKVTVLDHIIIAGNKFCSLRARSLI